MEAAHPTDLPVDKASLDEVQPDAWGHKITPDAFYDEVKADSRARGRMETVLTEINERQATLAQVRKARELTQATIAELLEMDQSEVSRLEHRSNMMLSTLRSFIRATGGELQLIVTFPDAEPLELLVGSRTANQPCPLNCASHALQGPRRRSALDLLRSRELLRSGCPHSCSRACYRLGRVQLY